MRKFLFVLVGTVVSIGIAGSASALNIAFGPHEVSGGRTSIDVTFELENDSRLVMQVEVNKGKLSRARVHTASSSGDARQILSADTERTSKSLVNIHRIRVNHNTGNVDFYFRSSMWHWHMHRSDTSEKFWVDYADLAVGDQVTFSGYRHNIFGSFGSTTVPIVPEPSAAVMVGLGILGLAFAGRKR